MKTTGTPLGNLMRVERELKKLKKTYLDLPEFSELRACFSITLRLLTEMRKDAQEAALGEDNHRPEAVDGGTQLTLL
jgi:hypothetical protein